MSLDPELLEPFAKLVDVTIEGQSFAVPENNSVLRTLQYLDFDLYPCRLCWNSECDNCQFRYLDTTLQGEVTARGCETTVYPGMRITQLPANALWPKR